MILSTQSSLPQARSFVLKLERAAESRRERLVGRLEHVATGRQFQFTSAEELIARLVECVAAVEQAESEA